jgi:hypothetical protein
MTLWYTNNRVLKRIVSSILLVTIAIGGLSACGNKERSATVEDCINYWIEKGREEPENLIRKTCQILKTDTYSKEEFDRLFLPK